MRALWKDRGAFLFWEEKSQQGRRRYLGALYYFGYAHSF
jgi:hypothetical protein